MATNQKQMNSGGAKLLSRLDFGPEFREDGGKTVAVETGRFKYFREVARKRNGTLLTANLMFIITFIPILVMIVLLEVFGGVEAVAYRLSGTTEVPYLSYGVGFGLSQSTLSDLDVNLQILTVYQIMFAVIGVTAFIIVIGFGGMLSISMKSILNDSFISKKDNYGNNVPRAIKEYFKGIKRSAKPLILAGSLVMILLGGITNLFIYFVSMYWQNQANAGHWIMIILAGILAIFTMMFLVHYLPETVLYDMKIKSKIKNSLIFSIYFFLQTFVIMIVFCAPFVLVGFFRNFISIIIAAVLLVYGAKWYSLILCNYEQYLSEKIINPIYNSRSGKTQPKKNNGKKR